MSEEVQATTAEPAQQAPVQESQPAAADVNMDQSIGSAVAGEQTTALPESFKDDASLSGFKSVEDLAKSYKHAEAFIGNSVKIPGEDASEEQRASFYEKLAKVPGVKVLPKEGDVEAMDNFLRSVGKGRPESADHYTLELEGADPSEFGEFKQFAYNAGMTQEQAQATATFIDKFESDQIEAMAQYGQEKLKEVWGPDYDNRIKGASSAIKIYGEKYPEALEALMASAQKNNPIVVAALSEVASSMKEKGVAGMTGTPAYGTTVEEAQMKIEEIMGNKSHAYHDRYNPDHDSAVKKVLALHEIVHNSK